MNTTAAASVAVPALFGTPQSKPIPPMSKKLPPIYFDKRKSDYWFKHPAGPFLNLDGRAVKLQLMGLGHYLDGENADTGLKDGDKILVDTMNENAVDYAGPLAGHKIGIVKTMDGRRCLVTTECKPIEPRKGKFNRLEEFLNGLFSDPDHPEQLTVALLWLKMAHESLLKGDFRPGQMLVLAGKSGCGKSLWQKLVTVLLGGRSAKPYRYMTGGTQFNSELCGAEHLTIEDEAAEMNITARRKFGASIKDFTVVDQTSVHGKGKDATLTMAIYKRCTLSVNDEPENLMVLPPLDESLIDKITILKCNKAVFWTEEREEIWRVLTEELPALLYYMRQMRIPKAWKDQRFGVRSFQHPAILEVLSTIAPETRLLDFIDTIIFPDADTFKWDGTAAELEKRLLESQSFAWQVQKLLNFSSACGTFLSRLQAKMPERFSQAKNTGKTIWTIKKGEA